MPFALLLALAAIAGATLLTYLYDRDATFPARLCAGVCTGFAVLGLSGFVVASFIGLNAAALLIAGALAAAPLLLLKKSAVRLLVRADILESVRVVRQAILRPEKGATGALLFYCCAALVLWLVFDRAMYQTAEGVFTGVDNNIGDLPFHLAIITGFAHGENFPPQHPEFAGVRLTYPFMVDFVAAMFVRAGASLQGALFWQNFALALSLTGLLHRWALVLTRDRVAALLTPALVLLSGGFGFMEFLREATASGQGVLSMLKQLPHDYTVMGQLGYRWGNAITTLFIPQRGLLFGVPLALVVWTLWWKATGDEEVEGKSGRAEEKERARIAKRKARAVTETGKKGGGREKRERGRGEESAVDASNARVPSVVAPRSLFAFSPMRMMLAAGAVAGLLPLVHAHSFVVLMLTGACLALLFADWKGAKGEAGEGGFSWPRLWQSLRPWLAFAAVASVIAVPQMLWATRQSGMRAGQFFGWEFGWDHGQANVVWFWIRNTALFIPLLFTTLLWRGREEIVPRRLLLFYLPFVLWCFVVPNVYRLSPWVWDNIKILFYWWIASAPLVALLLARLWRRGVGWRFAAAALLFVQVFAGSLDVWRVASGAVERQTFDRDGVAFAELIKRETPPRSLILHAPTYNDPVYLTGRRTFAGYDGHLWSHGIDYGERMNELKRIYTGAADAASLIERRGVEYVVVGPIERAEMLKSRSQVNESFFQRYQKVGEAGEYRLYKTRP